MQRVLLIVSLLAGFVCTYDLLNDLNDCAHVRGYYDYYNGPTTTYNLGFNVDEYRIKELTIGTEYRNRFFPSNRRESSSVSFSPRVLDKLDYQFTYVNDTRICYRIEFDCYNTGCPNAVYEILCQPMSTWKSPLYPYTGCYPSDLNGGCFQLDWGTCQELYVTTLFETIVTKPARVINGFRLSDCNGVVLSPNSTDWITVQEGTVDLAVPETKQQLVPVNNTNIFVQLMISVCPRTAVAITDLISSLNSFVKAVDLRTAYIALTVFDGAPDYVDLLYFSNNATLINSTIANLKNYVLRDDTCNVRQSVAKKFSEVSSYIYGQPWDTLNFVIYTATGDLVNYIPDDNTVTIPINRRADISTYLIGQNLPTSQDALFRALGVRGRFNTQDKATSTQAFTDVAKSIRAVSSGFTLFGYCSASRVGQISAKLKMNYLGLSDHPTARIMDLSYNASDFTPGCTAAHARDFCSPCSTVIDHHHIMCFECFNQSSVALSNDTDFAQVLLRAPVNGRNILYLPVPSSGAQFNVYIRFGGVSNPLLYDYKFLAVSQQTVELPSASKGALIGVYVDWNGYDYDASLGIRIEGPYTPPVTPPVAAPMRPPVATPVTPPVTAPVTSPVTSPFAQVPTAAPIPQYEVPVSYPAPIVAEGPIAAPVPQYETPVDYSIPLTVVPPVPQYDVPVVNEPYPGSDAPVNSPTQDYNPISQVPVDYSYPVAQVPVDSPVPVQIGSGPVTVPVGQESPVVATPQSATDAGTVADKNSDVSSGVIVQSGLTLVFALLHVAF